MQLVGLAGKSNRIGAELAGLLGDLIVTLFQACFIVGHEAFQVGNLSLPVDELLAESHQGETLFVLATAQALFLLMQAFRFGLQL